MLAGLVYLFVRRVTESPYGRSLRAMRDNDVVADSLGKNLTSLRTSMLVLGGAIAGLSGGVLVGFINLWDPAAWGFAESIVLFAAVIIGGLGNHTGAVLGAFLVPLGLPRGEPLHPRGGAAGSCAGAPVGGRRPRDRAVPLVPAAGDPPRATPEAACGGRAPRGRTLAACRSAAPVRGLRRPPAAPATVLEARGLVRSFDGVRAVDGVSVAFERGRLTGLIGPNGAGKSTLLAMLAGTLAATEGTVLYQGENVTRAPAYRRARTGLVRTFQLASEFKRLTVLENLLSAIPRQRGDTLRGALLGRRYWGAQERAAIGRAEQMLDRFGLSAYADTYAADLSGGQRRLVEIMRALMAEPQVLLLDEPMAGVHPQLARQIGDLLLGLCDDGITIVMVEHELAIMDEFADPVVVMADGRVLAQGTMAALRARHEVVEAYLVG